MVFSPFKRKMVGGTPILAPEKPGRFRNQVLVGYALATKKRNHVIGWLRVDYVLA